MRNLPGLCLGAVLALAGPAGGAQGAIALDAPRDYQVFQRQTQSAGAVRVAGRITEDCDAVEGRVEGRSPFGELTGRWVKLALEPGARSFGGAVPVPAGGWYRFELRALKGGVLVDRAEVPHVGVGEVFVVAGQSNATNYGETPQAPRSGMVSARGPQGWRLAYDPQPGVQDRSERGSFIPALGDALNARYGVPIGVAAVGHGSTSVRQWLPRGGRFSVPPTMSRFVHPAGDNQWECDGTLFEGMMAAVEALGRGGFRALLWHQGESDARQAPAYDIPAATYRSLMETVIRAARERAGWDFPWFVAQASYHNTHDPCCPEIRDAQKSLWQAGLALEGPDTDQLTGDNRQEGGRSVHFSTQGLEAHGRLWAEKVASYLDQVLDGAKALRPDAAAATRAPACPRQSGQASGH